MLSRVADSMFWMNRYMERAEGLLRVLHTNYVLSLDKGPYGVHTWKPVLQIFGSMKEDEITELQFSSAGVLKYLITNAKNTNSIRSLVNKARENARGMQDHITKEVWEEVNFIYHTVNNPLLEKHLSGEHALATLTNLLKHCLTYVGVTDTTMPRGQGWCFMSAGRFVERGIITADVTLKQFEQIEFNINDHKDILYWRNLLLSLSGYEVVFNDDFPHSISYTLNRLEKYVKDILEENNPPNKETIYREFGRIHSRVKFADENYIKQVTLQRFLGETKTDLLKFSHLLGQQFFSYA
jgi:uncharacterized alpha-E superfamily protein